MDSQENMQLKTTYPVIVVVHNGDGFLIPLLLCFFLFMRVGLSFFRTLGFQPTKIFGPNPKSEQQRSSFIALKVPHFEPSILETRSNKGSKTGGPPR